VIGDHCSTAGFAAPELTNSYPEWIIPDDTKKFAIVNISVCPM
jgi:hypothetical protein